MSQSRTEWCICSLACLWNWNKSHPGRLVLCTLRNVAMILYYQTSNVILVNATLFALSLFMMSEFYVFVIWLSTCMYCMNCLFIDYVVSAAFLCKHVRLSCVFYNKLTYLLTKFLQYWQQKPHRCYQVPNNCDSLQIYFKTSQEIPQIFPFTWMIWGLRPAPHLTVCSSVAAPGVHTPRTARRSVLVCMALGCDQQTRTRTDKQTTPRL